MEGKLQEKFALLQQMKRDKELKDAKSRETPSIDIFALAGVNFSTSSGAGPNSATRPDHPIGKRPHERSNSLTHTLPSITRRPSQSSTVTSPGREPERIDDTATSPGAQRKLKRSSMAARGASQMQDSRRCSLTLGLGRGRQLSVCSATSSDSTPTHPLVESPVTATPPTPISPPGGEAPPKIDSGPSPETQSSVQRVRDMTRNVHSRAGSMDENEEMILDIYGRSVPRSRRQSTDDGSDYGPEREDSDDYRSREGGRDYERPNHGGHGTEVDPYVAASRYLDTAFYPTKIYVGNLQSSVSLTSLRAAFKPFGDIEDMNLVEGKDYGFVTFREPAAARLALEKMNGALLEGAEIRVNRAKIPERNRHGFAGVAWTDEDGELAKMEEEQHKQAAVVARTALGSGPGSRSGSSPGSSVHTSNSPADLSVSYGTRPPSSTSAPRPIHQLPQRPASPKLPPKPSVTYPPVGADPRAAIAARGGGRQILRYDDL
ncbi:RNA-binding protein 39 [Mortierella sp. NVP85]|nr:RNA-binding protein 39 [Mortierella sp. NVP85]